MLIDPFTVIAQIINFLLLVWLLHRFLYGPVTRAMDAREERIRAETEEARTLRAEAEAEGERYRREMETFAEERETRLVELRTELDGVRREQMRAVRAEADETRERWQHALEQEQTAFFRELRQRIGHESIAVIRRALHEFADSDLDDRLVSRFTEQLRQLDGDDRKRLRTAIRNHEGPLLVRSAVPLSDAHRAALEEAVAELAGEAGVRFETDADLIAGVELRAGGLKAAWTFDEYLHTLEDGVRAGLLDAPAANDA